MPTDPALGLEIFTTRGLEKIRDAALSETQVKIKYVALGDANDAPYDPDASQTALVNERLRREIDVSSPAGDTGWRVKTTWPTDTETITIREIGFLDEDEELICMWAGADVPRFSQTGVHEYILEHVLDFQGVEAGLIIVDAPDDVEAMIGLMRAAEVFVEQDDFVAELQGAGVPVISAPQTVGHSRMVFTNTQWPFINLTGDAVDVESSGPGHLISKGLKPIDSLLGPGAKDGTNALINGSFDFWQRGTSFAFSGYGGADRWLDTNFGSTKVVTRETFEPGQTDVPGAPKYFMRSTVTSVGGNNHYAGPGQRIESVRTLAGETATARFWARADGDKEATFVVRQEFGTGGAPSERVLVASHKLSLSTEWQEFEIVVQMPNVTDKVLGDHGNDCVMFGFWIDAGSDYDAETQALGQQDIVFDLAEVFFGRGDWSNMSFAMPRRSPAEELALCQRYYQRMQNDGVNNVPLATYSSTNLQLRQAVVYFPTSMRVAPTVEFTLNGYNGQTVGTPYIRYLNTQKFNVYTNVSTTYVYLDEWQADAEL